MTFRNYLRALAEALPPDSVVPVPVEWVLELVREPSSLQTPANPVAPGRRQEEPNSDVLLTAAQVAERLATTPAWVYSHWRQALPFGQKLGHRTLRFSAAKLERHLAVPPRRGGTT